MLADLARPPVLEAKAPGTGRPTQDELAAYAAQPAPDAAGWLALAKRWSAKRTSKTPEITALLAVLPAPATWPTLISGLEALAAVPATTDGGRRQQAGWTLLAAALADDPARRRQALVVAREVLGEDDGGSLHEVEDALVKAKDDPQAVVAAVQKRLVAAVSEKKPSLILPDLVALVGEANALPVIRSALSLPFADLDVHGRRTRELAAREAGTRVDTRKAPPWSLVDGPAALTLFPVLEAHFPAK